MEREPCIFIPKALMEKVNIKFEGKRHLGAVIGTKDFKSQYSENMVEGWARQLIKLCEFAITQPQAFYSAYVKGFSNKFTHFMRTIEGVDDFMHPVEKLLTENFIPSLLGDPSEHLPTPVVFGHLAALPTRLGGMGIKIPTESAQIQLKFKGDCRNPCARHHKPKEDFTAKKCK